MKYRTPNLSLRKNGMEEYSQRYSNRHTEAINYRRVLEDQEVFATDQMNREQRRLKQREEKKRSR